MPFLFQQPVPTPALPPSAGEVFTGLYERVLAAREHILTGAIVFAVFFIIAWTGKRIIAYTATRVHADTGVVLLLSRVFYTVILILGILTALPAMGLDVSALIAGLGLTGFALGFALKDVLSNLLSGIMLLVYRPFNIGDQIKMGEYEGTITTIRIRDTLVRAYDGRTIVIPNTKLITEVVVNNNTAAQLVCETVEVGVGAGADVEGAREIIARVLAEQEKLKGRAESVVRREDAQQPGLVRLEGRYWCNPRRLDRAQLREEVTQAVAGALREAGIEPLALAPRVRAERLPVEVKREGEEEPERAQAASSSEQS
ncbi:MAG TPA: mechanosensitive ion channel family protein [Pyrinomonadaceae bacterium]|jgi:small-conductance mechanosensitive channel